MKKVKIGIVGCGGRIRHLVKLMLSEANSLEVAALFDPNPDAISAGLNELNPNARVYDNYNDLAEDPELEWIFVGSWNCFHKEQAIAALQAGKHVFCEKPLATTLEDCLAIRDAWLASDRIFFIGFTLRFSPLYTKIKSLLDEGAVGEIVSFEFNETLEFNHGGYIHADWRRFTEYAGTHLLEKCCHDIDMAHWLVQSLPKRVASFGGTNFFIPSNEYHMERIGRNGQGKLAYRGFQSHDSEIDPFNARKDIVDNQVAIIEYDSGVRATFHTNCNAGIPERRMYIAGTEGTIRGDYYTGQLELRRIGWDKPSQMFDLRGDGEHGGSDIVLAKQLCECVYRRTQPEVGLAEGLASAITCFAIDQSMHNNEMIDLTQTWLECGFENQRLLPVWRSDGVSVVEG